MIPTYNHVGISLFIKSRVNQILRSELLGCPTKQRREHPNSFPLPPFLFLQYRVSLSSFKLVGGSAKMATMSSHPGILHQYVCQNPAPSPATIAHAPSQAKGLVAFEHAPPASRKNMILFIGGLTDGFLTVPYIPSLSKALPESYSLAQVLLSSSYSGWGTSSLGLDVREIAQCVRYFRDLHPGGKIVLLGHSTGCQDVLHYLVSEGERPPIDGGILQAAVSDREALAGLFSPEEYKTSIELAQTYIDEGRGEDVLPRSITGGVFRSPISANRWISLLSPGPDHAGEDDYFSSDFDEERLRRVFGKAGAARIRLSVLYGEKDEAVPEAVDKHVLVGKWARHIRDGGGVVDEDSGIVKGATHSLEKGGEPVEDLKRRILGFIERLEGDVKR